MVGRGTLDGPMVFRIQKENVFLERWWVVNQLKWRFSITVLRQSGNYRRAVSIPFYVEKY